MKLYAEWNTGINGGLALTVDKPTSIINSRYAYGVWRIANNPFQTKNQRRPSFDRYPIESPEPVDSAKRNLFILYPFYAGPTVRESVGKRCGQCVHVCVRVCGWTEQFWSTAPREMELQIIVGSSRNGGLWCRCVTNCFFFPPPWKFDKVRGFLGMEFRGIWSYYHLIFDGVIDVWWKMWRWSVIFFYEEILSFAMEISKKRFLTKKNVTLLRYLNRKGF